MDNARNLEAKVAESGPRGEPIAVRLPVKMRHQKIMRAFAQNGFVSVTDMAVRIGVSTMTIRRDLDQLERAGKITRTHGGAVAARDTEWAPDEDADSVFSRRVSMNAEAKIAIGRAVAGLVEPSQAIGLDAGSTVLTAAQQLTGRPDMRFVTNNVRAAVALSETENRVYILGGEIRVPELSVVGSAAIKTLQGHFLDLVLLGVSAMDEHGIYDFSPEDTEVKTAFIESANRVVVLCDSSKFDRRALVRVARLEVVDILVTDKAPPPQLEAALRAAGVQILIASAEGLVTPPR